MTPEVPSLVAEPRVPHWGYPDLGLFLGSLLPAFALASGLVAGVSSLIPKQSATITSKALLLQGAAYLFVMGAMYLVVSWRYGRPFWRSLGWRFPVANATALIVAGPALGLVIDALGVLLKMGGQPSKIDELITSRIDLFILIFYGVVLGPIFEETIFRGFLYPLFARSVGPWGGIVLSTLPFGLLHGPEYHWAWQSILLISLAGALFGLVRYKSGSTASSFVLHAAYNATQFGLFGLAHWNSLQ